MVGTGGSRLAFVAIALPVYLALLTTSALGAETGIGFDHFPGGGPAPSGTIVADQWEAEGLKLAKAEEFGQTSVAGNCGRPTIQTETATPAASAPNFAVLPTCVGAFNTQGTYGALLAPARGSLSVEVRNLATSSSNVEVTLTGYASTGEVVAEGHGEATGSAWQKISAALNGKGQISYFAIATGLVTSQEVAIDNLTFEAPPAASTTPTPPPPPPPTASLALATPEPHAGQLIDLSGAASTPGSGRIISYGWNFRGGEKEETSTKTDPDAQIMFGPGQHTVTLIVTNSNQEHANTRFTLTIPPTVKARIPDGGEGECLAKLEIGDAHLLAECIQKAGGGYVIEGDLEMNGMLLVPRTGVLRIRTIKGVALGGGSETVLTGAQVDIELLNTPLGTMVLGDRDLEAEPVPLEIQGGVPPKFEGIYHGFAHSAAGGSGGSGTSPNSGSAKPSKTLLYVFGVGKQCKAGETKKAGCCPPPNGHIVCAEIPGNFPITGLVDVYLTNTGKTLLYVQVGLNLKEVSLEATGALEIRINDESGIELQSLKFEIGEAALKPIFKIKGASFEYFFPSYEEASKADTWQAKGTITFGEEVAQLKAEMAFAKGNFRKAAMSLKIKPGVPIYAGVFLNEIGATLAVEPLEFGGSLGASIAEVLELELEFRYREAKENPPELGYFGGEGRLLFKENKIASLAADVYSDGYVDAALKVQLSLPFGSKEPLAEVRGGASFWDETNHQPEALWQVQGEAFVKIWILELEGQVLVNNEYLAGCAAINGFGAQGHYHFKDGGIGGGFFGFSNCSDQLKEFREKPATKHSGGFVKEESSERAALKSARPGSAGARLAAAGESETFTLPEGTQGQELRITSSSSASPVLRITGPTGQSYMTPSTPKQTSSVKDQFISAIAPDTHQVLVLLKHPKGGTWTVQAVAGSGPLGKLETAEDLAPASVRVRVHHSHGRHYSLEYRIAHHVPGTAVRFVERGRDSTHVLGTVGSARGTLRFTPAEGLARNRTIVGYLLNGEGVEARELPLAHYTAPGPFRPAKVHGLRIARRRSSALVSWGAVSGARSYRVIIRGSDGRLETHILKPSRRDVVIPATLGFESFTATVQAVGGRDMLRGPAVTAALKRAGTPRPARRRARR